MREFAQLSNKHKNELQALFPGRVFRDVPLSKISRWRIGGRADLIVRPRSIDDIVQLRKWLYENNLPSVIIGATSNLLFSDEGLRAVCVQLGNSFGKISIAENTITAQAGVWVPVLARQAMLAGLTGLEHTCGIPATLGGLIYMNGGSQRKGIGDSIISVTTVDEYGNVRIRRREECSFAYRSSIFQGAKEWIVEGVLRLTPAKSKEGVRRDMVTILRERRLKFPRKAPNCGSVFKSDPDLWRTLGPPGAIIEQLGFKGIEMGGAKISTIHANFIINQSHATAVDVRALVRRVQSKVFNKYRYWLEAEPQYMDINGELHEL